MRLLLALSMAALAACTPFYVDSSAGPGYGGARVSVSVSFFTIPLAGAQDVAFVLDRSGSMDLVSAGVAGRDLGMSSLKSDLVGIAGSIANDLVGSPLPTKLDVAKRELVRTLSALPDGTRFTIIFFDNSIKAYARTLVTMDPRRRADAIAFVRRIEAGGSTAAVPALRLAYQAGARRVVLLSDGLANSGGDGDDLLAEARAAMRDGIRFDTVGLGIDQDAGLLRRLADESGGRAVTR